MDQLSPITATKSEPVYSTNNGHRIWNAEERRDISRFYKEGRRPSWIQEKYGATRGQIAGLIRRIREEEKLPKQRKMAEPSPEKEKPKLLITKIGASTVRLVKAVPEKRVRLRIIESETAVTLLELEPHHCKFPLGDPRQSDFRFCGCRRVIGANLPYCVEHLMVATQSGKH